MTTSSLEDMASAISELKNSGRIKELVNTALAEGFSATEIIEGGLRKGIDEVGRKYENCEYFLAELLFAGQIMNEALEVLEPRLRLENAQTKGVLVLGTVRGDVHDIGKNVFKILAQASGFEVHDLGVDVETETFAQKVEETGADILCLSTLLTTTLSEMKNVIDFLEKAGLRSRVRVLLGGNAVTSSFAQEIHADCAALNAVEGVGICRRWLRK